MTVPSNSPIPPDLAIIGGPMVPAERLVRILNRFAPARPLDERIRIGWSYTVYGRLSRVGNYVSFIQGAHETGWFLSPRWVKSFNPAGLGATNDGAWGSHFEHPEDGIVAQFAHLLAYALKPGEGTIPQKALLLLDPRLDAVTKKGWRGAAPTWRELEEKWATGKGYGDRVLKRAREVWIANQ